MPDDSIFWLLNVNQALAKFSMEDFRDCGWVRTCGWTFWTLMSPVRLLTCACIVRPRKIRIINFGQLSLASYVDVVQLQLQRWMSTAFMVLLVHHCRLVQATEEEDAHCHRLQLMVAMQTCHDLADLLVCDRCVSHLSMWFFFRQYWHPFLYSHMCVCVCLSVCLCVCVFIGHSYVKLVHVDPPGVVHLFIQSVMDDHHVFCLSLSYTTASLPHVSISFISYAWHLSMRLLCQEDIVPAIPPRTGPAARPDLVCFSLLSAGLLFEKTFTNYTFLNQYQ